MQIYYDCLNINLRFWSWSIYKRITDDGIYITQNITGDSMFIPMSKKHSVLLDNILTLGVDMGSLIDRLNSFGLCGEDYYVLFMQRGIIE